MPDLPTLAEAISSRAALEQALCTLLEPSTSLREHLVPALSARLESAGSDKRSGNGPAQSRPTAYTDLVDAAEAEVATWSPADKADFLGGHPRIGEVKNLSALSSKEQSGATQTPPEVLAKLETLNALYESRYPKLKYVTYVAGRTRAQVAEDLEAFLMPKPAEGEKDSEGAGPPPTATYSEGSPEWTRELERGLKDVFKIAKARLRALNVS